MNNNHDCEDGLITLIVPTMNRSEFLIRMLRYYNKIHFKGCICIGDSSNPEHIEKTKKEIETFQGTFNIIYKEYPGLKAVECLNRLIDLISSPYAVLLADDDFLVPSALDKCVMFLERNHDYAAAHGLGVILNLESDGPYGPIANCEYYPLAVLESESSSQRLTDLLCNYKATHLSVHRIESLRTMFKDLHSLKDNRFGELLCCSMSGILGKSKELDCLYLVRQDHAQRYISSDTYDWITCQVWHPSYLVFCNGLAEALALQDNISLEEAQKVVKRAFWKYIIIFINPQLGSYNRWSRCREIIGTIPTVKCIWRFLHSFSGFSLSALLRTSSPYHSDFIPVYKALTTPPTEFSDNTIGK